MHHKTLQTFQEIFQKTSKFNAMTQKLHEILELNQWIQDHIDVSCISMCQVANLRQGVIVLTTQIASYAHHLRFATMPLLKQIRQVPKWRHLTQIQIRVQPGTEFLPRQMAKSTLPIVPSKCSAHLIANTALHIHNATLKAALKNLSQSVKQLQS